MTREPRGGDLRRRALESHKTTSKKTQAKIESGASSAAGSKNASRASSRVPSRAPSDDEDYLSDGTNMSTHSLDDLVFDPLEEDLGDAWKQELTDRMDEIVATKRSTIEGREKCYARYNRILSSQFCEKEVEKRVPEILAALLKSVKNEPSEKETIFALRAIAITLITCPSDTAYDALKKAITNLYTVSESMVVKAAAIHSLGPVLFYGGAGDSEMEDVMDELLEIIESDGQSIEAADAGNVVEAALQEWAFFATEVDDLEDKSEAAMEAFSEQLQASDARVQIAAGQCIALLYEKSYTDREEDDEPAEEEEDDEGFPIDQSMVKRYDVYRQTHLLKETLASLAKISSKSVANKDRKRLHETFRDVLNTVNYPQRGPHYSNAIDQETGRRYGNRLKVKIPDHGVMHINKWSQLIKLEELRRILGGGFVVHYEKNEVVFNTLPVIISPK